MLVLAFEFRAASEVVELAELLILLMWNAGNMVPRTLILLLADAANVNQTDLSISHTSAALKFLLFRLQWDRLTDRRIACLILRLVGLFRTVRLF